jgi:hypothetical protein
MNQSSKVEDVKYHSQDYIDDDLKLALELSLMQDCNTNFEVSSSSSSSSSSIPMQAILPVSISAPLPAILLSISIPELNLKNFSTTDNRYIGAIDRDIDEKTIRSNICCLLSKRAMNVEDCDPLLDLLISEKKYYTAEYLRLLHYKANMNYIRFTFMDVVNRSKHMKAESLLYERETEKFIYRAHKDNQVFSGENLRKFVEQKISERFDVLKLRKARNVHCIAQKLGPDNYMLYEIHCFGIPKTKTKEAFYVAVMNVTQKTIDLGIKPNYTKFPGYTFEEI